MINIPQLRVLPEETAQKISNDQQNVWNRLNRLKDLFPSEYHDKLQAIGDAVNAYVDEVSNKALIGDVEFATRELGTEAHSVMKELNELLSRFPDYVFEDIDTNITSLGGREQQR